MAAAFVGVWKLDRVDGAEEYFHATGQTEALQEIEKIASIEILLDGTDLTTITNIDGRDPRRETHTLGETYESQGPGGVKIKAKSYMDGDKLVSEGSAGEMEWIAVRYFRGSAMVTELTSKGKTMTFTLVKV
ncbi:uncharacterized protein LOC131944004 [Physella acuta]|uniref:uncharacterized protein LOC131944004 n=1 Tax=Physella acuta TaxID=109671 RepID=UPI0027DD1EDC|nr:uncharacterized protein LOC131944004 [Physella acuta]